MAYSVDVQIFSTGITYHETVATGDDTPGNVTATYGLADPLTISQGLQQNDRLPLSHPEPDEATVTLIAATAATYAKISLGDPIAVKVYPQAAFAGTPVTFYGRVATLACQPHQLGLLYTLGCVDYTVDLAALPVGLSSWPQQSSQDRVARIFSDAGVGYALDASMVLPADPFHPARSAGQTDALSALITTLDSWPVQTFTDENGTAFSTSLWRMQARPRLVQKITADLLDTTTPFLIAGPAHASRQTKRVRYAPPARLVGAVNPAVTVSAADSSPSTGAPIVDGARVEFAPTYTQQKGGDGVGNVVVATIPAGTTTRFVFDWRTVIGRDIVATFNNWWSQGVNPAPISLGGPQVVQALDFDLDNSTSFADMVYNWRVPFRPDVATAWTVGTIEWQAWKEPTAWRRPNLTELFTVSNVKAGVLPTGRRWITGLVVSTTLAISKGRPVIAVQVIPSTYDHDLQRALQGSSLGVASLDSPILAGKLLSQLIAGDTFADYAITRGS